MCALSSRPYYVHFEPIPQIEEFKLSKKDQKKYEKLCSEATWHEARKAARSDETDPHHQEAERLKKQANELYERAKNEFLAAH